LTEAELQKRIAYQFGLINGNIVLPNILLTVGRVGHYEADLLYITPGHFDFIPEEEQKYCWNCGAIMDGESE
jgi:hypothetical protein